MLALILSFPLGFDIPSIHENTFSKKYDKREYTKTCGGSGGNFSAIPLKASLPPYCVIKNGTLIFREKRCQNEFLRTFERV